MNKKGLTILSSVIMLLAATIIFYGVIKPRPITTGNQETKVTNNDIKIAFVNEDNGVVYNGDNVQMSSVLLTTLKENTEYRLETVSRAIAEKGLENGNYNIMLVLPSKFSEDVLALESNSPKQAIFQYKIKSDKKDIVKQAEQAISEIKQFFNKDIINVYFSSIIGNLQSSQTQVGAAVGRERSVLNKYQSNLLTPLTDYSNQFKGVSNSSEGMMSSYSSFHKSINNTNEAAQDFALKATIDPSQIYNPNSTYIYADKASQGPSDLLTMSGQVHYNDNTGLQQLSGNDLTFYLGQGAAANKGGEMLIHQGNYAYAIYETTLKSKFEPNSYKATVANADINLQPYDTYIRRCSNQNYNITLGVSASPNNFVASNRQDDGSATFKTKFKNRLLTKIVSTPFNVYITNYDTDGNKKVPDAPVDVKVELVESCTATTNLYEKDIRFDGVSDVLLSGIHIDRAYKSVKFRISHLDSTTHTTKIACEKLDDFAIRPSHFRLWDTETNTANTNNILIGGKPYDNIALAAMKPLDSGLANGYTNNISGSNGEIRLLPAYSATCDPSFLEVENKLSVDFNDKNKALGKFFRHTSSGTVGFSYSDIGDTYFHVLDKDFTLTDQHTPAKADDCVKNSTSNDPAQDPAQEGRIGCNIKLEGDRDYYFRPKDIEISNLKIIKDGEITYLDNQGIQKAKITFDVVDIKLDRVPLNFTDNDGNAGTLAKANEEILFFEIPGSNTIKSIDPGATKATFYVDKKTFVSGKAKGEVYFNFDRKVNRPKNPFTVSSDDFSFSGMSNGTNETKKYEKSPNKTSVKFYFGRVYAPFYEGLYSGFYAKIYYGAYCDGCDKNAYMKNDGKLWQDFPAAPFWSTNPKHSAGVLSYHDFSFTNTYSGTVLRNDVGSINNGEQVIFISNPSAVTDVTKMRAPSWLLYSEFDEKPETNNFNINFLVPNGEWAGKVLKSNNTQDKTDNAVGGFIGVKSNSDNTLDISDKTNRRIEW